MARWPVLTMENHLLGVCINYRLRGMEQPLREIEDVQRGIELGIRGFLIYDGKNAVADRPDVQGRRSAAG